MQSEYNVGKIMISVLINNEDMWLRTSQLWKDGEKRGDYVIFFAHENPVVYSKCQAKYVRCLMCLMLTH
jgi:hypothetical protein